MATNSPDDPYVPCFRGFRQWVEETYGFPSPQWVDAWADENKVCLRPDGHDGPHVWQPMAVAGCRQEPRPDDA